MANRRMTQYQINSNGYYNQHPYNNKESRWCDLNEVPYAKNGYLYGPETVEDQITGQVYYHLNMHKSYANLYTAMVENTIDPTVFFKEGDSLLIRHQQADVRFTVTGFSSRAKNMVGTRHLNLVWQWDQEGWLAYKKKNLHAPTASSKTNWQLWRDRNSFWTTGSVKTNIQPDKIARFWSWQAVPKEVFLKFQLLGFA